MPTSLKDIIGAILTDTIRAQHDTNNYLSLLSDQYSKNGKLEGFAMPSAKMSEIELTMKYAVTGGIVENEEEGVNSKEVSKTLRYIARESAELLIKTLVHCIQESSVAYQQRFAFIDTLPDNRDFRTHFQRRLLALLVEENDVQVGDELMSQERMSVTILPCAQEQLVNHVDLQGLYQLPGAENLPQMISEHFASALDKDLDDIMRESKLPAFRTIQRYGSLMVEVDSDAVSKMDPSQVQQLRIKVGPGAADVKVSEK